MLFQAGRFRAETLAGCAAGFAGGGHYVEAVRFGGGERTYQAWYGVDSTTMYGPDAYPQFNAAGA